MRTALEKTTVAVGAERLHDTNVNVGVVVAQEGFAIDGDEVGERTKIIVKEVLAEFGRQISFGVEEQRSDIVLQSAFAAALVVHEIGLAVTQHDIARLEITIEKEIARGLEEEIGEAAEVVFESVFVERNPGQTEKIVF